MMSYLIHIFFMVYFLSRASLFEVEQSKMTRFFFREFFILVAAEPAGDPSDTAVRFPLLRRFVESKNRFLS